MDIQKERCNSYISQLYMAVVNTKDIVNQWLRLSIQSFVLLF